MKSAVAYNMNSVNLVINSSALVAHMQYRVGIAIDETFCDTVPNKLI